MARDVVRIRSMLRLAQVAPSGSRPNFWQKNGGKQMRVDCSKIRLPPFACPLRSEFDAVEAGGEGGGLRIQPQPGQGGGIGGGQDCPVHQICGRFDAVVGTEIAGDLELQRATGQRNGLQRGVDGTLDGDGEILGGAHGGRPVVGDDDTEQICGWALGNGGSPIENTVAGIDGGAGGSVRQAEREDLRRQIGIGGGVGEVDGRARNDAAIGDGSE
jgi:hypothetical protein